MADETIRFANAMASCCASRYDGEAITLEPIANGEVSRDHVRDHGRDEEWTHTFCAFGVQHDRFTFEDLHATNARTEHAGEATKILRFEVEVGLSHRFVGGDDAILHELRETARFLLGESHLERVVTRDARDRGHAEALLLFGLERANA